MLVRNFEVLADPKPPRWVGAAAAAAALKGHHPDC